MTRFTTHHCPNHFVPNRHGCDAKSICLLPSCRGYSNRRQRHLPILRPNRRGCLSLVARYAYTLFARSLANECGARCGCHAIPEQEHFWRAVHTLDMTGWRQWILNSLRKLTRLCRYEYPGPPFFASSVSQSGTYWGDFITGIRINSSVFNLRWRSYYVYHEFRPNKGFAQLTDLLLCLR